MAAQDKASRLAHADRKRNLSDHRSASPLANFLVKGNSLDFAHKKSKVLMSVGSPAFHNKGGRPKHRPWCNFMAIEVAASLRFKRLLAPGDCLPASFNGKACYFRLDKKAKKTDTWTVGVCNKGTADTGGEKPRASGGVHKMTTAEIRAALVVEEAE